MTKETAKRRIPLIKEAIKKTQVCINEAVASGNKYVEDAHRSYLESCLKGLREAEQRLL